MKKTGFILLMLMLTGLPLIKAQKPIRISTDSLKFGNSMCPGVWVSIPEVNIETVRKDWIKSLEKGTKSKAVTTGNEITIFGTLYKDISENPVNVYSTIESHDSLVKMFVAVELSRDQFPEAKSKENEQLKNSLRTFARDEYKRVAEDQLSDEQSKLKDLEKDLTSLRKSKEKLEKEIQYANSSIDEENYKIATTKKEMEVTDASLDSKGTDLSSTEDGDAKKALQSEIKDLQKKKKDEMKAISTSENKITKANATIQDNNNSIKLNLKNQEDLGEKITLQKIEVQKYTDKLKTIEAY